MLVAVGTPVWAQAGGPIERQFTPPPALPSGQGPSVPATPGQQPPQGAENVRLTLTRIDFRGGTVPVIEALVARQSSLLGREVSLAEVFRYADDLTQSLRNEGYVLSRVIVPPQNIRDGVLVLQFVEGYVAQTRLQGTVSGPRDTLDRHMTAIRASRPLAASVLERELLLMNDLPGIQARSTIGPSATPGAADMTVDVTENRGYVAGALNNRGSRSLGPWRVELSGEANQLLGGFDRFHGRLVQTLDGGELTLVALGYERAIGADGLRVGLNGSYVDSTPGSSQNFELPTNSSSLGITFSGVPLRSRTQTLRLRAGFGHLRSQTDVVSGGTTLPLSEDKISALRVGGSFELVDGFRGLSVFDVELSKGLGAFGASRVGDPNLSVSDGRPDFKKLTVYAARLQSIVPPWSLLIALAGQHSRQVLLAPERFAFGGEPFGRAFDTAELTGDSGAAVKLELRYAGSTAGWLRDYTAYAFAESGTIRRKGAAVTSGQQAKESASDVGFGIRVSGRQFWSGYFEIVKPLGRDVAQEGNRDARAFVGAQAAF